MGMVTSFVFALGGANRYLSFENHMIKEFNFKIRLNLSKSENDINLFYAFWTTVFSWWPTGRSALEIRCSFISTTLLSYLVRDIETTKIFKFSKNIFQGFIYFLFFAWFFEAHSKEFKDGIADRLDNSSYFWSSNKNRTNTIWRNWIGELEKRSHVC